MFKNPRRGRQARNFTTNVPKNSRSQIVFRTDIFRKLSLGAPGKGKDTIWYLESLSLTAHADLTRRATAGQGEGQES